MASYSFSADKYIESEQGHLGICSLSGNVNFVSVPTNAYFLEPISWYEENDYVFYAIDHPSVTQYPFDRFVKIANINGVEIFGAIYISDLTIPSGTPIDEYMVYDNKVKFYVFSGDFNGEVTETNPTGVRIASFQAFEPCKEYVTRRVVPNPQEGEPYEETTHFAIDSYYLYFGTYEGGEVLCVFDTPLKEERKVILSEVNPLIEEKYHDFAYFGELNTWDTYSDVITLDIRKISGESIDIDELPTETDGGTSTTGGGGGTFTFTSTNIGFPSLPSLGASNSGMMTIYNPTYSQLRQFSDWLWSNDLLDNLTKMFAQPLDLIISLSISPVPPNELGIVQDVKIGGVNTNIQMQKVSNQYAIFDCGRLKIPELYGSALDYGQYTKISLVLPFCNTIQLKTDEVMGSYLHIKYFCDLFSGSCVAMVALENGNFQSILYSVEGNMAVTIPLVSRDFSGLYNAIARTSTMALTGGIALAQAPDSAMNVMASKPAIQRSGGVTSTGGLMGVKTPYIIIEHPHQSLASNFPHYCGYPSNITALLSSLKGYTEVDEIIVSNFKCTQEEQDEIVSLLKEGVYL